MSVLNFHFCDTTEAADADCEVKAISNSLSEENVQNVLALEDSVIDATSQDIVDCQLEDVCLESEQSADADTVTEKTKSDDTAVSHLVDKTEEIETVAESSSPKHIVKDEETDEDELGSSLQPSGLPSEDNCTPVSKPDLNSAAEGFKASEKQIEPQVTLEL